MSGDGVVRITALEGGWVNSSAVSVCWHREVFWRHGWDVALHSLGEGCEPLLLPAGTAIVAGSAPGAGVPCIMSL